MAPKHYEEDKSPKGMNGTLRRENQESSYEGIEIKLEKKISGKYFFEREEERREWYEISTREKQGMGRQ